ncbi:hypothetical protein NPIL_299831 [Nephila pilipes]|uniref:Uncharacterized protein n=1 Tax=Nephila pilipes TaxID=299642 RepID=A0A8X6NM52_NEPPI|nr:hypothetical protein NPIL_299831 [Nephila pilipes]
MRIKNLSRRLARWALRLQKHDFVVKCKTGKMQKDAGLLLRNPVEEETEIPDKFQSVTMKPETEILLDTMLPFCPDNVEDNHISKIIARAEES